MIYIEATLLKKDLEFSKISSNILEKINETCIILETMKGEAKYYIQRRKMISDGICLFVQKILLENAFNHYNKLLKLNIQNHGFDYIFEKIKKFINLYLKCENYILSVECMLYIDQSLLSMVSLDDDFDYEIFEEIV